MNLYEKNNQAYDRVTALLWYQKVSIQAAALCDDGLGNDTQQVWVYFFFPITCS